MQQELVRFCPKCKTERSAAELSCEGDFQGAACDWNLLDLPLQIARKEEWAVEPVATSNAKVQSIYQSDDTKVEEEAAADQNQGLPIAASLKCENGHDIEAGDIMCLLCGGMAAASSTTSQSAKEGTTGSLGETGDAKQESEIVTIDGWKLVAPLPSRSQTIKKFRAASADSSTSSIFTLILFASGAEPDRSVYLQLKRLPEGSVSNLIAEGHHENQAYEVWQDWSELSLEQYLTENKGQISIRDIAEHLSISIARFAAAGIRHRDISPANIYLRAQAPLEISIGGFQSALLSEFDLDIISPLATSRYTAPETLGGGVSAASDWWSLGVILLELATNGRCFEGINENAFLIHVVTTGITLPSTLDKPLKQLLRGLLDRDPHTRWQAAEIERWLRGEIEYAVEPELNDAESTTSGKIVLAGKTYNRLDQFALAAADSQNWREASDLFLRGAVGTWIETDNSKSSIAASIRNVLADTTLSDDLKVALGLLVLNAHLPFSIKGEIVNPGWLLANLEAGTTLLSPSISKRLRLLEREPWLLKLSERAETIRKRLEGSDIPIDEERLRIALLSTSRRNLELAWAKKRKMFPDTSHLQLRSLIERRTLSDEDLIILISCDSSNLISADEIIEKTKALCKSQKIDFDQSTLESFFSLSRRQVFDEIDQRISGFARCGNESIDNWADTYRLERRIPLERALLILLVPKSNWKELPKQQYITEILRFSERRIMATINQGPLVFLRISKSSLSLDLTELGSARRNSEQLLNHLLARAAKPIELDPEVLDATPQIERRIRGLVQKTNIFRRDTGKNGLFLGFPFVVLRTKGSDETKSKLRVAPVLLFPVRIETQIGNRGLVKLSTSTESDEVRLNPALTGILNLSAKDEEKWKDALNELMGRSSISSRDVLDLFCPLCELKDPQLTPLPNRESQLELGKPMLSASAAIFHCDFAGKAVADDLSNIASRPISGTALEVALRVVRETDDATGGASANASDDSPAVPDHEPFTHAVIAADPSQEQAIVKARQNRGLHIEGPPGTGKSQTIVNIIADCVARHETALVVCQKQAALSIVEKRLKAEGLGNRLFYITDMSKDRQPVIKSLRDQLDRRDAADNKSAALSNSRAEVLKRLDSIAAEIDNHHNIIHKTDTRIGLNYRSIIAQLISVESGGPVVSVPRLRTFLGQQSNSTVAHLEEDCSVLAQLWLSSQYESSHLDCLKCFAPSEGDRELISHEFERFLKTELNRERILNEFPRSDDADDISTYESWILQNQEHVKDLRQDIRLNLSKWTANFFPDRQDETSKATQAMIDLKKLSESLRNLDAASHSDSLFGSIAAFSDEVLKEKLATAESATTEGGFLVQFNPVRLWNRLQLSNYLSSIKQPTDETSMRVFLNATKLELSLRPLRSKVESIALLLDEQQPPNPKDLRSIQRFATQLLEKLLQVDEVADRLLKCPARSYAREFAQSTDTASFEQLTSRLQGVLKRHAAKNESIKALESLLNWFAPEWLNGQRDVIKAARNNVETLRLIQIDFSNFDKYQEFRLRVSSLDKRVLEVFALLREREIQLKEFSARDLGAQLKRIIRKEARLAWKALLETKEPLLTASGDEISAKVQKLAELDLQLRAHNRSVLSELSGDTKLASARQWEDITRLTGARTKRLREIISVGSELGLMKLRPIWLMNPETASRLLPLNAGLFDAVIFDEASQLQVEYALPSLYRAKRAIVSGDQKQMPPASFFATRLANDEEMDLDEDELDELLPQEERDRIEDSWNRREIKDCPDLLTLARSVMPSNMLQIHYRSEFRELIAFSNAAFYNGALSIPTKRPLSEIKKGKPIEVIRVDSVYEKQTNRGEALKIAEILQKLWSLPAEQRPTVGVVSFNLKQSDLIEEILEDLARDNPEFKEAFEQESTRKDDGEDVGFFVKNLENVQGDERDIIIFSTTFGKDKSGSFRRNFGKLGQFGGERRLNVAITRAKRKVILVSSIPVEKISDYLSGSGSPSIPRDFVQAYLDYASKISDANFDAAQRALLRLPLTHDRHQTTNAAQESDAVLSDIAAFIRNLGYAAVVRPALEEDAFSIDIAIEDPVTGLFAIGIECDSPEHRLLSTAIHRDIWRPAVLRKSIARIHRIQSRDWYQNREQEKHRLQNAIEAALQHGEPS